ncbi:hypothetical protein HPB49_004815 [Dermacentor silvarum]|uniref:Uncharacterized protein n=1 Tax=Dermacentor silvarum TaxID=543639 RepID=A0ACB8DV32_DERSI|nr:hypothetical protein HPB49_004815 [Dermacentor silvarum]
MAKYWLFTADQLSPDIRRPANCCHWELCAAESMDQSDHSTEVGFRRSPIVCHSEYDSDHGVLLKAEYETQRVSEERAFDARQLLSGRELLRVKQKLVGFRFGWGIKVDLVPDAEEVVQALFRLKQGLVKVINKKVCHSEYDSDHGVLLKAEYETQKVLEERAFDARQLLSGRELLRVKQKLVGFRFGWGIKVDLVPDAEEVVQALFRLKQGLVKVINKKVCHSEYDSDHGVLLKAEYETQKVSEERAFDARQLLSGRELLRVKQKLVGFRFGWGIKVDLVPDAEEVVQALFRLKQGRVKVINKKVCHSEYDSDHGVLLKAEYETQRVSEERAFDARQLLSGRELLRVKQKLVGFRFGWGIKVDLVPDAEQVVQALFRLK